MPQRVRISHPSHGSSLDSPHDAQGPPFHLEKTQPSSPPTPGRTSPLPTPSFRWSRTRSSFTHHYHHSTSRSPMRSWRAVGEAFKRSIHQHQSRSEGDRTQLSPYHKKDSYPSYPSRPLLSCRLPLAYRHRDFLHPQQSRSRLIPLHSPILPRTQTCFLLHP